MDIIEVLKSLPSATSQAVKDYLSGLGLFFNRRTWMHSVVFLLTLLYFTFFRLVQPILQDQVIRGIALHPIIGDLLFRSPLAALGALIGFIILGLIAITSPGHRLMFESRARHLVSPLVIGGLMLLFTQLPNTITQSPAWREFFGRSGLGSMIFQGCWFIILILQVILLGYTIIKAFKWFWGYLHIPETNSQSKVHWVLTLLLIILIPVAIWVWLPIIRFIMMTFYDPPPLPVSLSVILERVPGGLLLEMLLQHSPLDYSFYLWGAFPLVALVAALLLWRNRPQVAIAVASFGIIYPALVFYYRFRVFEYLSSFDLLMANQPPAFFVISGLYETGLLLLTFLMVLQGVAKHQRKISPNPFGLFALMISSTIYTILWIFQSDNPVLILLNTELFNAISTALSALVGVFVFALLPLTYGIHRIMRPSKIGETVQDSS